MAPLHHNTLFMEFQGFQCKKEEINEKGKMVLQFKDNRSDTEILCPCCSSYAVKNGKRTIKLNDVPISPGLPTVLEIEQRRFRCLKCGKSFKSFNPFKSPDAI